MSDALIVPHCDSPFCLAFSIFSRSRITCAATVMLFCETTFGSDRIAVRKDLQRAETVRLGSTFGAQSPKRVFKIRSRTAVTARSAPMVARVAVFSADKYVVDFLERPLQDSFSKCTFTEAQLDLSTAALAESHTTVCCFVNDDLSRPVVERLAAVGVRFVAMRCAGFDRVDLVACKDHSIQVARVPTYSPASVAEHAVALLLCLNRNLHKAHIRMWGGDYSLSGLVGFEVRSKTVGIIGTGAIGSAACRIFLGFGSRVLAHDMYQSEELKQLGVAYVSKEDLLRDADIVSLHCPLLPSTWHIIDRASIEQMKKGAIIVNVSRGGLIDTDATLDALESSHLGGLALDVYEHEGPLFFKNWSLMTTSQTYQCWDRKFQALKSLPNVLITPHSAFLTAEALASIAAVTVSNIQEFEAGKPLTNLVTLK